MKTLLIAAAFIALPLAFGSPASAEPVRAATTVSTAGLDLTTSEGVRSLDLRIAHAASDLCGTPSSADARGRVKAADCRAQARADAGTARNRAVALAARPTGVQLAQTR